jgi:uroporphyrinogen-III decarboxylase
MSFFLTEPYDFDAHNDEVRRVWDAYHAGTPERVPVSIVGSITNYLLNSKLNTHGWTFRDFFENPDVQIFAELEFQKWQRFNLVFDQEMGLPETWQVRVNFQNSYDAGWVGCPLRFWEGQVPDTEEILKDDKDKLFNLPAELPIDHGLLARAAEFYEYMQKKCPTLEFEGRPVLAPQGYLGEGCDGPLDLAYKLRGAENLLVDMLADEDYYHALMTWITDNLIRRMKALRERRWARYPDSPDNGVFRAKHFYFADDAIALISTEQYREFVYPYHRRIFDAFSDGSGASMHLCGDATRHFPFLAREFNVVAFDTGFPVDHGRLREELGPEVQINGGPTVMTVKDGSPADIEAEVRRICASGVMRGGKFVMIAANNLAPRTPVENIRALYEATKQWGRY